MLIRNKPQIKMRFFHGKENFKSKTNCRCVNFYKKIYPHMGKEIA